MAAAAKKGVLDDIGESGLSVYGGRIYEEPLNELSGDGWRRTLRKMQNDAVINGILLGIEMLSRQVTWEIKPFSEAPRDKREAEFIDQCLFKDMALTWQETLSEILSFLPWGWSYFEICYKRREGESADKTKDSKFTDGQVGWRKFAIRAQESLDEWVLDDFNEVSAMNQRPAPDYKLYSIPIQKALHFRTSSSKDNPEGRSILRGAYREWLFKTNIQNIEGIGIERDLAGLPVFKVPEELFAADASAAQKTMLNAMREMVKQIRRDESEGIVMPAAYDDAGHPTYEFTLLSTGGRRQFDTSGVIDRCDHRILLSVLADFMLLGTKAGSYSLSTDKTELFSLAISAWLDSICETINRNAIPSLIKLNGRKTDRLPQLTHGPVEGISLGDLGEFLNKTGGLDLQLDDEEKAWLKQQAGIPATPRSVKEKLEKEKAEREKEEQQESESETDPETKPDDNGEE